MIISKGLFARIGSFARNALNIGHIDVVIVDKMYGNPHITHGIVRKMKHLWDVLPWR
jgi:hypothetical protein